VRLIFQDNETEKKLIKVIKDALQFQQINFTVKKGFLLCLDDKHDKHVKLMLKSKHFKSYIIFIRLIVWNLYWIAPRHFDKK
jgi:hypothetical protein